MIASHGQQNENIILAICTAISCFEMIFQFICSSRTIVGRTTVILLMKLDPMMKGSGRLVRRGKEVNWNSDISRRRELQIG